MRILELDTASSRDQEMIAIMSDNLSELQESVVRAEQSVVGERRVAAMSLQAAKEELSELALTVAEVSEAWMSGKQDADQLRARHEQLEQTCEMQHADLQSERAQHEELTSTIMEQNSLLLEQASQHGELEEEHARLVASLSRMTEECQGMSTAIESVADAARDKARQGQQELGLRMAGRVLYSLVRGVLAGAIVSWRGQVQSEGLQQSYHQGRLELERCQRQSETDETKATKAETALDQLRGRVQSSHSDLSREILGKVGLIKDLETELELAWQEKEKALAESRAEQNAAWAGERHAMEQEHKTQLGWAESDMDTLRNEAKQLTSLLAVAQRERENALSGWKHFQIEASTAIDQTAVVIASLKRARGEAQGRAEKEQLRGDDLLVQLQGAVNPKPTAL